MKITEKQVYCDGAFYALEPDVFSRPERNSGGCVNIYPVEKQEILGFGGAFTESSAYNYSLLSPERKEEALRLLFGPSGLRLNFCRICLGSSDFSLGEYTYRTEPGGAFDISRDKKYVIPFIKDAQRAAAEEIFFFASPWSPPAFMKTTGRLKEGGKLEREYYPAYAEYEADFIEAYRREGIKISALTVQNEPEASMTWESCVFSAEEEAAYLSVLDDTLKARGLDVKILCWDHNKGELYNRAKAVYAAAGNRVWGAGFHWYWGGHFGELELLREKYPEKVLIETELCYSHTYRFNTYRAEIQNNLNRGVNAVCDWNMILDEEGGPFHNRKTGVDAPLCLNRREDRLEKHGLYGQMYMFSHYIRRGAKMLYTSSFDEDVTASAARNPDGEIVVQLHTRRHEAQDVFLKMGGERAKVTLLPDAIVTLRVQDDRGDFVAGD